MLSSSPDDAFAFRKLVSLYQTYSTLDRLILEYQAAIKSNPKDYSFNVVLGRLYMSIDRFDDALKNLESAAKLDDKRYEAFKNIGTVYVKKRNYLEGKKYLDKALVRVKGKIIKKRLLKELVRLTVMGGDIKNGIIYFDKLLKISPDFHTRWEFAGLLNQGLHFDKAMSQYEILLKASSGDSRRKVEVLKAMGDTFERKGEDLQAVKTYWKAMALTAQGHWVRRELINRLVSIYRRRDELHLLLDDFKKRWGRPSGFQYSIMGKIMGEIGKFDMAVSYYRRAIRSESSNVDYRQELIGLLEKSGASPGVIIAEQEALARSAPDQLKFTIELARRYQKAGNLKKALSIIENLQNRNSTDAGLYLALADLYSQWNKPDKAIKMYEKLVVLEPLDYEHYINLGQQYWGRGKRTKALEVWNRILKGNMFPKKEEAYYVLAGVFLEIGQLNEAWSNIKKACDADMDNTKFLILRAQIQTKQRKPKEALKTWEKALKIASKQNDFVTIKKIRKQLLVLWKELGILEKELRARLRIWKPADISNGMFLAEGFSILGNIREAERILLLMRKAQGALSEPLLGLISLYESAGNYKKLVPLLEEAIRLIPHRAREFYEYLSNTWLVLGDDNKAKNYLRLAMEKGAKDSKSWAKAAELAVKLEDYRGAIKAYTEAIRLDPYEMDYYFSLASLYLQMGEIENSTRIYYQIISKSSEDEIVEKAAKSAMDLDELTGNLGRLEKILHPMSFVYSHRAVFGKMLMEVYKRYVPWLNNQKRQALSEKDRTFYEKELNRLKTRALKPLLESLTVEESLAEKESARAILAKLGNPNSAIPIIRLAKRMFEQTQIRSLSKKSSGFGLGELAFIRKSLSMAIRFKNKDILPELRFFLNQEKDTALQIISLRGMILCNAPPNDFLKFLNKNAPVYHGIVACSVLSRDKNHHKKVTELIKDPETPAEMRAGCMKTWVNYGNQDQNADILYNISIKDSALDVRKAAGFILGMSGSKKYTDYIIRGYISSSVAQKRLWLGGLLVSLGILNNNSGKQRIELKIKSSDTAQSETIKLLDSDPEIRDHVNPDAFSDISGVIQNVSIDVLSSPPEPLQCKNLELLVKKLTAAISIQNRSDKKMSVLKIWNNRGQIDGLQNFCKNSENTGRTLWKSLSKSFDSWLINGNTTLRYLIRKMQIVSGNYTLDNIIKNEKDRTVLLRIFEFLIMHSFPVKLGNINENTLDSNLKFYIVSLKIQKFFNRTYLEKLIFDPDPVINRIAFEAMVSRKYFDHKLILNILNRGGLSLAVLTLKYLDNYPSVRINILSQVKTYRLELLMKLAASNN